MRERGLTLLLATVLGCGGSGSLLGDAGPDGGGPVDVRPADGEPADATPADVLEAVDATPDGPPPACTAATPASQGRAFIALKDGNASVVDLATRTVAASVAPAMAVSTDAALRYAQGTIWVVNRYGYDNVVLLDAGDYHVTKQFSTGSGSNPQDVAVLAANRVYVPLYQTGEVLVADPTQPDLEEEIRRIDLTGIDPDPSPTSAVAIGTKVYVALAFVDPQTYTAKRNGMVVVIDTVSDTIAGQIDLHSKDPFARMQRVPGGTTLVVDGVEDFSGAAGCFEAVDTAAGTAACVVDNAACGGWSGGLTVSASGHVWAAVAAGFQADGTLCHFTLDGTVVASGLAAAGGSLTDVGLDDRCELLVADVKTPGAWVYGALTDAAITTTPLDLGAAPAFANGILFLP